MTPMMENAVKNLVNVAIIVMFAVVSAAALAAIQTVTLSVSGMTCGGCVIAVKKSLTKIDGVTKADVSLEKAEAAVSFDDAKTNVEALLKATAGAGFPSTLKKQ